MYVLYHFDDNLSSIRSKYVMTMYKPVNAMYGIFTKQVNHRLMADLLQICNRSVTDMLHTSNSSVAVRNSSVAVSNTDL